MSYRTAPSLKKKVLRKSSVSPAPKPQFKANETMENKDKSRKWMWWFLGVVAAFQLYFVRELLAAFALFAVVFAAIAVLVMGAYMLQKTWEVGVARLAASAHPVMLSGRRAVSALEDLARRPLRRPGSAAVRSV
jgi:hypothetical protein